MQLPKTFIIKKGACPTLFRRGFTLIEILVTISIFIFLIGISLCISFENLERNFLFSESDLVTSLLERARSEAINNINEESHSFIITDDGFKVDDYSEVRNKSIKITGPSEIIFQPLSGNADQAATFILTNGYATSAIYLNVNGIIK